MASLVLGAVGAYFGGAQGWLIGSALGNALFPGSLPDQVSEGPRLSDLKVQASTYGQMIPWVWGQMRMAGNLIWSTDVVEHRSETSTTQGGKGGPSQTSTSISYTYTVDCAIAVCRGPIVGIARIWANGELLYDVRPNADPAVNAASNSFATAVRVYQGTTTQAKSALMVAADGDSKTPAYRDLAYVEFEGLDVTRWGGRIPSFEFEVVTVGSSGPGAVVVDPASTYTSADGSITPDGLMLAVWGTVGGIGQRRVAVVNPFTWAIVREYPVASYVLPQVAFGAMNAAGDVLLACGDIGAGRDAYIWPANSPGPSAVPWVDGATAMGTMTNIVVDSAGRFWFAARVSVGGRYSLVKIDSGSTTAEEVYPFANNTPIPTSIAQGDDGYFYVISPTRVDRVSPDGGLFAQTASGASNGVSSAVVAGDGSLWVLNCSGGTLYRYPADLATRTTIASYGTGGGGQYRRIARDYATGDVLVGGATLDRYSPAGALLGSTATPSGMGNLASPATSVGFPHYQLVHNPDAFTGASTRWAASINRNVVTPGTVTVATIVTDICGAVGLAPADLDVSALTDSVHGYGVGRRGSARSAIDPLARAFAFGGVESDYLVKFRTRASAAVLATILEDELIVDGESPPFEITRRLETEIPRELTVVYLDKDADYQQGSEYERRLIGGSVAVETVEVPIAISAAQAKQIAQRELYRRWVARDPVSYGTTRKYADYEPGDVVAIAFKNGITRIVRQEGKDESRGIIRWTAASEDVAIYTQAGAGAGYGGAGQTVDVNSGTDFRALDIPIVRDADDDPGFYGAAAGYLPGWTGSLIYKSTDGGASYAQLGQSFFAGATMGLANTVLGSFGGGNQWDGVNTVDITLSSGTLASDVEANVFAGSNAAYLGGELIQFLTATLIGTNKYRLSGLLRGRRGTEQFMTTHAAGDLFVLLSGPGIVRVSGATAEIGVQRFYKAPAFGLTLAQAGAVPFTNTGAGLKPPSPVHLAGGRNGAGDLTLTWVRRTRVGGEWRDFVDAALGESSESYEVEIWTAGYGALKRTISGLSTPTATYTSAQQVTDFGANQAAVAVRVYQISAAVGRGFKREGAV